MAADIPRLLEPALLESILVQFQRMTISLLSTSVAMHSTARSMFPVLCICSPAP